MISLRKLTWFFPLLCAPLFAAEPLVILNGNIYTANTKAPRAEAAIAVDGRITFVGTTAEARKRAPRNAQTLDLRGLTVFPGLTDAHAHLDGIGERELSFNVEGASSLADLKQRVRERHEKTKAGEWIAGSGWIESRWTPAAFPTKAAIDEVAGDRPVILWRVDGHAALANSRALALAGVDRNTPDPAGGSILKDAATGEPTGMLIDNAMDLVSKLVPKPTQEQITERLEVGAARSVRLGWTQLQIAGNDYGEVDKLCRLYKEGKVKLRLYNAIQGPGADADRLLKEGPSLNHCSDRFTVRGIKLYIDGALGSRGAALLEPYSDAPGNKGLVVVEPQSLIPLLTTALKRGVQVETHAIGDRGNRIVLDLYQHAFAAVPAKERAVAEPRWRIEHAQHLTAADIPRFKKLGVIASMQPSGAISDMYFAPSRLGPERLPFAYAWKALLDTGAVVVAGSDAPVEKGDPIIEFYAAAVRRSQDGFSDANWHRELRVSREQALHMLSIGPAYAAFQEKDRGSIEVGKQADFTVFSADLMTIPDAEILKARVVKTIIAGEVAYSEEAASQPSAARTDCDRACLEGLVDQYLEALVRKDPTRVAWAPNARFTENNVELAVGDGLWATISKLGDYRLKVADTLTGQAGFFGVVEETVDTSAFAMRLKIENRRILEAETIIVRLADMGSLGGGANPFQKAVFADKPVFHQVLTAAERRPRERLISVADGYFDTLQLNDGVLFTEFDPACVRVENGVQTTGNPAKPLGEISALGCADQFKLGYYRYDDRLRARRFPLVDEERGLVLASAFIDHAGTLGKYTLTDGKVVESPLRRPHTFYLIELFKIRDGRILQIEAAFTTVPYRMPSPWKP
jgi:predicted amidohydrolase YtcJ